MRILEKQINRIRLDCLRLRDFISEDPQDGIKVGLPNKQQMELSPREIRLERKEQTRQKEERESRRQQENII